MSPQFTVLLFRYSNHVAAMVAFLEELGRRRRIDSEGSAELHAGAGRVMVHAAGGEFTGGQTYLNLITKTVEDVVDVASRAGCEYLVWDEAYGRHALVAGPHGEWIWVNEEQAGDYGYRRHEGDARPDLAQRLTQAGYLASVVSDGQLTKVHVTDPDGVDIEIHSHS